MSLLSQLAQGYHPVMCIHSRQTCYFLIILMVFIWSTLIFQILLYSVWTREGWEVYSLFVKWVGLISGLILHGYLSVLSLCFWGLFCWKKNAVQHKEIHYFWSTGTWFLPEVECWKYFVTFIKPSDCSPESFNTPFWTGRS